MPDKSLEKLYAAAATLFIENWVPNHPEDIEFLSQIEWGELSLGVQVQLALLKSKHYYRLKGLEDLVKMMIDEPDFGWRLIDFVLDYVLETMQGPMDLRGFEKVRKDIANREGPFLRLPWALRDLINRQLSHRYSPQEAEVFSALIGSQIIVHAPYMAAEVGNAINMIRDISQVGLDKAKINANGFFQDPFRVKIINNLLNPIGVVLLVIEARDELVARNMAVFEDIDLQGGVTFDDPLLQRVFEEIRARRTERATRKPFTLKQLKGIIQGISYEDLQGDLIWEALFEVNQKYPDYQITSQELGEAFRAKIVAFAENIEA